MGCGIEVVSGIEGGVELRRGGGIEVGEEIRWRRK